MAMTMKGAKKEGGVDGGEAVKDKAKEDKAKFSLQPCPSIVRCPCPSFVLFLLFLSFSISVSIFIWAMCIKTKSQLTRLTASLPRLLLSFFHIVTHTSNT